MCDRSNFFHRDLTIWTNADKSLADFFHRCFEAGSSLCPFSGQDTTTEALMSQTFQLLDELKYHPLALPDGSILDSSAFRNTIRIALYGPSGWVPLAPALDNLFDTPSSPRNMDKFFEAWKLLPTDITASFTDESAYGIHCGDKTFWRTDNMDDAWAVTEALMGTSITSGEIGNVLPYICAHWKFKAKETYGRRFADIETRHPLLMVGNTLDPATPFENAQNTSSIFVGSVALEHGGIGVS